MAMRHVAALLAAGCMVSGYAAPAKAIGCISGGVAGAVAGHLVHHGVLGALGGCIAGHQLNKRQKMQDTQDTRDWNNGSGTGRAPGSGDDRPQGGPDRNSN